VKIKELKYIAYSLPFSKTFSTAKQKIKNRRGIIIRLEDEEKNIAYGEAAPLPKFSSESFSQTEEQISSLTKKIKNLQLEDYFSNTIDFVEKLRLLPSVRFAVEQALLGLYLKNEKDLVIQQLKIKNNSIIPVNAVFGIEEVNKVFKEVSKGINSGYETIKIKLGKFRLSEEEKLIKMIREKFGGSIKIRLDANSSWSYDQAISNIECFEEFDIEFIEEPCTRIEDSLKLIKGSPIPIALDESIKSFEMLNLFAKESKVKFLVLKPMTLGSIYNLLSFIPEAEANNIIVIISSLFESVVGRSALVFLSSVITHEHAHGIGVAQYFKKDLDQDPFPVEKGLIKFGSESYPSAFNIEKLFQ